ncbi:mycofactocin system FadH/OYE family oxidoreductase 2 [Pseudonocardia sp. 73-21]|uniref:mycofactocin system FadH/OYE family oxidoreductase 2 n=1 Tax=Pseudonocardia sp. 73-21 TaxID=1895809 RepID=UPI000962A62D|nr:mycofactocin system FadH/OYE family oxidoreductase 2 [Pseudonocardia sp. 73-21]OJY37488.1 MAG: 2,4-dienoyl-CoA reductase [Pseudonocardia sp. 73-21]
MLFTPLQLGPLTVRNRIVFTAHLTNAAVDGRATEQHAAYYAARAAGGAGMIITEEHSVHPADRPYEKLIRGHDPAAIPGYRRLTAAVHAHGVPVLAQLNHNGGQSSGMYSRLPVWAPSPLADPLFREVAKEITVVEIAEIVDGYARTAAHCVEGGFDGVELQCSHASLLRQFLSPLTNLRTDTYGTDRSRVVAEVVAAVRDAIGPDRVLGVRLCGDEGMAGGITIDDAVETARRVEPHVDYLNTSIGVATSTLHLIEASMHVPRDYAHSIPAALRKAVARPVIGVGRFGDHEQAQRALDDGVCDLVGVVRGQVADPDFARRAPAEIRTCSACNQECVGRVGLNRWLGCAQNPRAGRESVPLPPLAVPRRVLVVGGGPAGLQAAATAASRGHRVTLCERSQQTGGQVRLAATAPGRAELTAMVDAPLAECLRLGVEVRTGVEVDAALVERLAPDAVVLATGAVPELPGWAAGLDHVVDVRHVLAGDAAPSGRVLIPDELGFHQATSVAELLAARGCSVEIMTPGMVVGQDLGITLDMENFHRRAAAAGIALTTDRMVVGARAGVLVDVLHHTVGATEERRYDWVVCASPPRPDDALWHAVRGVPVHRIGDCLAPRRVHAATVEGARVGAQL